MEYSLTNLLNESSWEEINLNEIVNTFNLIGLEVDLISRQKNKKDDFFEKISLQLKIPSNRDDLTNQIFFEKEIAYLFPEKKKEFWEKLTKNYLFLLKQTYEKYQNPSIVFLNSSNPNFLVYGIEIENLKTNYSPLWLQEKLKSFGIVPVNNFQDFFQLISIEWGQGIQIQKKFPSFQEDFSLWKFDFVKKEKKNFSTNFTEEELSLLSQGTIVLRQPSEEIYSIIGELNYQSFNLDIEKIRIEASLFQNIEKFGFSFSPALAKIFKKRFLENLRSSFQRCLTLLELCSVGSFSSRIYRSKKQQQLLSFKKIIKVRKISFFNFLKIESLQENIFKKAGLKIVCQTPTDIFFQIPSYRKDLTREIDLIEEYSRFVGYENFFEILPTQGKKSKERKKKEIKKRFENFFLHYGFEELITNPLHDSLENNELFIQIENPLKKEFSLLRPSLLPALIDLAKENFRSFAHIPKYFEIGRVFQKKKEKLIEEEKIAALFSFSQSFNSGRPELDWFFAIGFLENLLFHFGKKIILKKKFNSLVNVFHPNRSILIKEDDKILGVFGQINPKISNFSKFSVFLLELSFSTFFDSNFYSWSSFYQEYSKYPTIKKDLSFIISKTTNFFTLKESLFSYSKFLKKTTFFDLFFQNEDPNLVTIGIHLEFQSSSFTLTKEIIEKEIEKIKQFLCESCQAEFRD